MQPTAKLRFIERDTLLMGFYMGSDGEKEEIYQKIRILQQWWAVERDGQITPTGEWRDVPTV